jgi:capsid portal protein
LKSFVAESAVVRWFKEFGDDRIYDCTTGEVADESLPEAKRANEVVHFRIYSPRSPYGIPRYIGALLTIFGDRKAEEINYVTFRNNQVPSLAILVSNGALTDDSIDRIEEFVKSQIQGQDNFSKILILEAESSSDDEGEDSGNVRIAMEPLTKSQIQDALFQEYSKSNQDKVRRAWRLPPILIGKSEDYTRSTADTSRRLADEQIFEPERQEFDSFVNRRLFPAMGIVFHKFKSNSPNTTDNAELVKILSGSEKTGGMTPRIARMILEDVLGQELPEFPADFPADSPFSLLMADAVKNKADASEPGQQVTALKRVVDYFASPDVVECTGCGEAVELAQDDPVSYFLNLHRALETQWRAAAGGGRSCEDHDHE